MSNAVPPTAEQISERQPSPDNSVTGFFQNFSDVAEFLHRVSQEGGAGDVEVSAISTDQGVIRVMFTGLAPQHAVALVRESEAVVEHESSVLRRHLELRLPPGILVPGDEEYERQKGLIRDLSGIERRNPRLTERNDGSRTLGLTGNALSVEQILQTVSGSVDERGDTGSFRYNSRYIKTTSDQRPLEYSLHANSHVPDSSPEVGSIVRISVQGASGSAVRFVGQLIERVPISAFSIQPVQRIRGTPKHAESLRYGGTVEDVVVCVEASCAPAKLQKAITSVSPVNLADISVQRVSPSLAIQHAQIILPKGIASEVQQSLSKKELAARLRPSSSDTSRTVMTVTGACNDVRMALQALNEVSGAYIMANPPVLTQPTSTIGTPKMLRKTNAIAY